MGHELVARHGLAWVALMLGHPPTNFGFIFFADFKIVFGLFPQLLKKLFLFGRGQLKINVML